MAVMVAFVLVFIVVKKLGRPLGIAKFDVKALALFRIAYEENRG